MSQENIKPNTFLKYIDQIPTPSAIVSSKGNFLKVNQLFTALLGYTSKEATSGADLNDLFHPEDIRKNIEKIMKIGTDKLKNISFETRLITKDGETIWTHLSATSNINDIDTAAYLIICMTDINRQKYLEEEFTKKSLHEDKTSILLGVIQEHAAHALVSTNPDGVITSFNPAAEKLLGYKAEELIGKETPGIFHDRNEVMQRSQKFSEELNIKLEPGFKVFTCHTDLGINNEFEWTYIHKNGTKFPVLLSITALINKSGKHIGYLGIAQDISKIKAQELKLEAYLKGSLDGFWQWDILENYLEWDDNLFRIMEFEPNEFIETFEKFVERIHPDDFARAQKAIEDHLSKDIPFDIESRYKLKSGEFKWFRNKGKVTKDMHGNPARMAGSLSDISKKKELEIELKNTNKELEQFAYIASHDLKAPLRGIGNLSRYIEEDLEDFLKQDGVSQTEVRKNLGRLARQVQRMQGLIAGILEYSRTGKETVNFAEISLNIFLNEIIKDLSIPEGMIVKNLIPNAKMKTDELGLSQVFSNLISNAIKYHDNPKAGTITIQGKEFKNHIKFSVADDGPGIDPRFHKKIFEIFQTLKPKDEIESTGIGLSLVKKIVESKGGGIQIQSNIGDGAIFFFEWPLNSRKMKSKD